MKRIKNAGDLTVPALGPSFAGLSHTQNASGSVLFRPGWNKAARTPVKNRVKDMFEHQRTPAIQKQHPTLLRR